MLQDTEWQLDEQHPVSNSNIGGDDITLAYVYPKQVDFHAVRPADPLKQFNSGDSDVSV